MKPIPERVEEFEKRFVERFGVDAHTRLYPHPFPEVHAWLTTALTETDQQAREYCNAWIDPQKEMPEHNIQVLCAVQHFTTKRIVYDVLETKECDDAVWFDGDGEIDCWNWNVIGWKHIPTLSNPPSQV